MITKILAGAAVGATLSGAIALSLISRSQLPQQESVMDLDEQQMILAEMEASELIAEKEAITLLQSAVKDYTPEGTQHRILDGEYDPNQPVDVRR